MAAKGNSGSGKKLKRPAIQKELNGKEETRMGITVAPEGTKKKKGKKMIPTNLSQKP